MKYIKHYEQITHTDKYLVWNASSGNHIQYYILEVIEPLTIHNSELTSIYLYSYNHKEGLKQTYSTSKNHIEEYEVEKEIIYQSDNLQDCINYIILTTSQNKYNL